MFKLSSKKALGQGLKCKVHLLVPGEELEVCYTETSTGQDILNDLVGQLDLLDKDYYGLKFYDHIQWLDPTKSVLKQTKGNRSVAFVLRFKYYPAEPALLANESTRYYLYLQLRADLLEGRLKADCQETLAFLIACVLQSELGDSSSSPSSAAAANKSNLQDNYVAEYKFVPNQDEELEWAAIRLHRSEDFFGLGPGDAELNFLKKACQLDSYGIDPYPVKEGNSHNHFLIGVNHNGISTFQDSRRTNLFNWDEIERISLDNKLALIYCKKIEKKGEKLSKTRSLFAFRCPSQEHAHNFWKVATEHKYFFTLDSTPDLPLVTNTGGLFKKSHKLKYVGRVEKDLLRDRVDEVRSSGVKRSRSLMAKTSNGPLWQGFQQGGANNLQSSVGNLYASNLINKTLPSNMNYFREEEEYLDDALGQDGQLNETSAAAQDVNANLLSKDAQQKQQHTNFSRKQVLQSKTEQLSGSAIRRGSQVYMDTEQQNSDFKKASLFLILVLAAIFLTLLLVSDPDRPNSISLLVKKMNLEHVSVALRQNYYLPLKTALRQGFGQVLSILDSKLL